MKNDNDQPHDLPAGVTRDGQGFPGDGFTILGQRCLPMASYDSCFAFQVHVEPGQYVPVHIHSRQDEFLLLQDGEMELKLDGQWLTVRAGDLVRMPRGVPHGYFNKSRHVARMTCWASPSGQLEALFEKLHGMTDLVEFVRLSAEHDVHFLPPEANA